MSWIDRREAAERELVRVEEEAVRLKARRARVRRSDRSALIALAEEEAELKEEHEEALESLGIAEAACGLEARGATQLCPYPGDPWSISYRDGDQRTTIYGRGRARITEGLAKVMIEDSAAADSMAAHDRRIKTGNVTADDINSGWIPDSLLVTERGWEILCRVRGASNGGVSGGAWIELCRRRGYLLARHNSRGF